MSAQARAETRQAHAWTTRATTALFAIAAAWALTAGAAKADIDHTGTDRLDLTVQGSIAQSCTLGDIGAVDFGDLTAPGLAVVARLPLSCNVPFDLDITSANGGLANTQYPQGQGDFAGRVDYSMRVDMPVRDPGLRVVTADFTSNELTAGRSVSSGEGVAFDGALLSVRLHAPSGVGLLAGEYVETIQLSVSPKL